MMHTLFATLICLVFLVGCKRNNSPTPVEFGNEHQILHIGNSGEPQELDPQLTVGLLEMRIETALFEGLTTADPKTLEP
ncbi:MAG TPA: hypothetical protein PLV25_00840, partial [Opitutales bacterium]|nr:hypothetical protein [Opitutales bacterium]